MKDLKTVPNRERYKVITDESMILSMHQHYFERLAISFQSFDTIWIKNLTAQLSIFQKPLNLHELYIHAKILHTTTHTNERKFDAIIKLNPPNLWNIADNFVKWSTFVIIYQIFQKISLTNMRNTEKEKQTSVNWGVSKSFWTYQTATWLSHWYYTCWQHIINSSLRSYFSISERQWVLNNYRLKKLP